MRRWRGCDAMLCVSCGKKEAVTQGLCGGCYSEKCPLEIKDGTIKACMDCGSIFLRKWRKEVGWDNYVSSHLKGLTVVEEFGRENRNEAKYSVEEKEDCFIFKVETREIPEKTTPVFRSVSFRLQKRFGVCPPCQKKRSSYFEAILQIRREGGRLQEHEKDGLKNDISAFLKKEKDPLAFVAKVKDLEEGIDFEIGGKKIARKLGSYLKKKYGGRILESKKIMGRNEREGKDILRSTLSLKLPSLLAGDFVIWGKDVFRVANVSSSIKLSNALEKKSVPSQKIPELERRGNLRKIDVSPQRVIVTSLTPTHVEILKGDYTTQTFRRPKDLKISVGEEYEAIILEEKIFWV